MTALLIGGTAPRRAAIGTLLRQLHLDVEATHLGIDGLDRAQAGPIDLVVLLAPLPDLDHVALCRELRVWSRAAIVVVDWAPTAETEVNALDAGADDVIVAPDAVAVVTARLRVALRRTTAPRSTTEPLVFGDVELDVDSLLVRVGGRVQEIQPRSAAILGLLARHPDQVVAYEQLCRSVWGGAPTTSRLGSLRTSVRLLRRTLGDGVRRPAIQTITGRGYRLTLPATARSVRGLDPAAP